MNSANTVVASLLGCLVAATSAGAAVVTWEVDATFDDGGRAAGFFQFDGAAFAGGGNGLGKFDIVTTRGSNLSGTEYASGLFITSAEATRFATNITNNLGQLSLLHTIPLSDAGGTIDLTGGSENFGNLASRALVSGKLVGMIPEASTFTFLALGLVGIVGTLSRKRRRIKAVRSPA